VFLFVALIDIIRHTTPGLYHSLKAKMNFYRATLRRAPYCHSMSYGRPPVTMVDRDHTNWNSSKITSRLDRFALCTLLQREHHEILAGVEKGRRTSGCRRTKALISVNRGKIGPSYY